MQDPLGLPTWPSSRVGLGGVEGDQWAEIKVMGNEPPVFGGGDFSLYPADSGEFCLGRLSSQLLESWKHLEKSELHSLRQESMPGCIQCFLFLAPYLQPNAVALILGLSPWQRDKTFPSSLVALRLP